MNSGFFEKRFRWRRQETDTLFRSLPHDTLGLLLRETRRVLAATAPRQVRIVSILLVCSAVIVVQEIRAQAKWFCRLWRQ